MNRRILRLSRSFFLWCRHSEDKSSSSITYAPILAKDSEKSRSLYRSLDGDIQNARKQRISSQFTPKTARSVTIRWADQSIGSFSTVDKHLNFFKNLFGKFRYQVQLILNNF
jgi:hypothetical protein